METLLQTDAAYVQERFLEIQGERRRHLAQAQASPSRPAKVARETGHWGARDDDEGSGDQAASSDTVWAATKVEKGVVVMTEALRDLVASHLQALETNALEDGEDAEALRPAATKSSDTTTSPVLNELPLSDQFGFTMFFRLCESLRASIPGSGTSRLLAMVAPKIPSLLDKLPPVPLSPGVVTTCEKDLRACSEPSSVFEELLDIFSKLLESNLSVKAQSDGVLPAMSLNNTDRANVLTAYVALSIKFGRLRDITQALRYLLEYPAVLAKTHVETLGGLLSEMAKAEPETPPHRILPDEPLTTGFLVSFGKGDHGKLGHGQCSHTACSDGNCTENKTVPTVIGSTRDVKFVKIDSLSTHSIAITTKGEVMAWGNGDKYRLGHGTMAKEYAPRVIDSLSLKGKVSDVACGLGHTLALMANGDIYAWGNGSNGRLGVGDTNDRSNPTRLIIAEESQIAPSHDTRISQPRTYSVIIRHVMCGASHSQAITSDGRAFAWGKNNQGQCGHGHTNDQLTPLEIRYFRDELNERIIHVAGGWEHTLFCSATGRVYSCGCGYKDSRRTGIPPVLGHGDCEKRLKPTVVQFFVDSNEEIARVSCGWDHSLALSAQGALYTWGSGTNGKLGHGDEESCDVPSLVRSLSGKVIIDAKAGCEHTVALTDNHELWTFGQGDSGRLGLGDAATRKLPAMVDFFAHSGLRPVAIAVGDKYNLILADNIVPATHPIPDSPAQTKSPRRMKRNSHNDIFSKASSRRYVHSRISVSPSPSESPFRDLGSVLATGVEHSDTPLISEAAHPDDLPIDQAHVVRHILCHLARLATGYANVHFSDRVRVVTTESSPKVLPYGIDTTAEALRRIVEVIRLCQKSRSSLTTARSELQEVILVFLRLLAVNLSLWPTHRLRDEEANLISLSDIREVANTLAEPSSTVSAPTNNHLKEYEVLIQEEAAHTLQIGFYSLYTTTREHMKLLWEIMSNTKTHELSLREQVILSKLCENSVARAIVLECARCSSAHVCLEYSIAKPDPGRQLTDYSVCRMDSLVCLMEALLVTSSSERSRGTLSNRRDLQQELLCVLHTHLIAVCSCKLAPVLEVDVEGASNQLVDICECCFRGLEVYIHLLLGRAIAMLTEIRQAPNDPAPGFLVLVLRHAMEAVCAFLDSNGGYISRPDGMTKKVALSEAMHANVKTIFHLMDELALTYLERNPSNSSDLVKTWIVEQSELCAILLGEIASCYVCLAIPQNFSGQKVVIEQDVMVQHISDLAQTEEEHHPSGLARGMSVFNDALGKVACSHMKEALILKLAQAVEKLPRVLSGNHSATEKKESAVVAVVLMCKQLNYALTSGQLSNRAAVAALSVWLWFLKCRMLNQTHLSRLINETAIVTYVGDIQKQVQSRGDSLFKPRDEWIHALDLRATQRSARLRPVEMLIDAGKLHHTLQRMARKLFATIALRICESSVPQSTETHPLVDQVRNMVQSYHATSLSCSLSQEIDDSSTTPTHSPSKDTVKLIFDVLVSLLQIAALSMKSHSSRISPLCEPDGHLQKGVCFPTHAFLLASPFGISSARSHILKPLRLPGEDSRPRIEIGAATLWMYIDESSLSKHAQTSGDSVVTLVALGEPSERIQESGAQGGTTSPIELSGTDGMCLVAFLAHVSNGLRLGIAFKNNAQVTAAWASLVTATSLQTGRWTHISITLPSLESGSCIYIDGEPTLCEAFGENTAIDLVSFGSCTSRTQALIGGTTASTFKSAMGISTLCSNNKPAQSPRSKFSRSNGVGYEVMVDDIWIFPTRINESTAKQLFDQGQTVLQLKRISDVDADCRKSLCLLRKLLKIYPIPIGRKCEADGQIEDKPVIVDVLFALSSACRHEESSDIARMAVKVMTKILPALNLSQDTCMIILESLMDCLLEIRPPTFDLRASFCRFYSLTMRGGASTAPVSTSLQNVMGLLVKACVLKPLSSLSAGGNNYGYFRLLYSSIVQLVQGISKSPTWRPNFSRLMERAVVNMCKFSERSEHSLLSNALATISVVSGYSEVFINDQEVQHNSKKGGFESPWSSTLRGDKDLVVILLPLVGSHYGIDLGGHLLLGTSQDSRDSMLDLRTADEEVFVKARIQCAILRWILGQLICSPNQEFSTWFREQVLSDPTIPETLCCMASKRIGDLIKMRLGVEKKRVQKLLSATLLLAAISRPSSTLRLNVEDDLEPLASDIHARFDIQCQAVPTPSTFPLRHWRSPSVQLSPLECLSGNVEICEQSVRAIQHFPTVRLGRVTITANTGLWYHEVLVMSDGLMQIGYIDNDFVPDAVQGQGVGDHANSWAYDGYRRKKWNVSSSEYGEVWQAGDVVGVLLDTDRMELSYFLNDKFLGVAFSSLPLTSSTVLSPAISLNGDQSVEFRFGQRVRISSDSSHAIIDRDRSFQMPILHSRLDRQRLKPVSDALNATIGDVQADGMDINDIDSDNSSTASGDDGEDNDTSPLETPTTTPPVSPFGIYHRPNLANRDLQPSLPGSLRDVEAESQFASAEHVYHPTRGGSNREDGKVDGDDEDPDQSRQDGLVRALVALGFPLAWAVRCARETPFAHNDTGAVSWILEQMEKEAVSITGDAPVLDTQSSAGADDLQVVQSAISKRSRDDLSLVTASRRLAEMGGSRNWQLNLSPTRDGRPHSEQLSRSGGIPSSPTRLLVSGGASQSSRPADINPFLHLETEDDDDDDSPERGDGKYLNESGKIQSLRQQFAQLLLVTTGGTVADSASEKGGDVDSKRYCGDEDLLPVCFVSHSVLSLAYIRLIVESLLFDPNCDLSKSYLVVEHWVTREPLGLFSFLRAQLQLNPKEQCVVYSHNLVTSQETRLREAFVRMLVYERSNAATLLHSTVVDEIRSLVAKGMQDTRRKIQPAEPSKKTRDIVKNSEWVVWLVVVLEHSLDELSYQGPASTLQNGLRGLVEGALVDDVVKLAATNHAACVPWRVAAFRILKLVLMIGTSACPSQLTGTPSILPVRYFVELLAYLLRRNQSTRIAFDEPIPTIWAIVQAHLPPPPPVNQLPVLAQGLTLCVEHIASTNVTISWEYQAQDEPAKPIEGGLSMNFENTTLSLDVLPCSRSSSPNEASDFLRSSVMNGIPHSLPHKGTLVIRHLAPDSYYTIRVTKTSTKMRTEDEEETQHSAVLRDTLVQTPREPVFELSSDAMGKNLQLSNRNRTVKNLVNKKWHTVRASVGYDEGLHHWHVRVDSCVSKNIFIGVCTVDATMDNYVGSDSYGYGFLANKAVWHNKTKIHTYGEIFKQGDLLQVALDCNARTLSFSRNGEFLGVAATNLRVANASNNGDAVQPSGRCKWYPAFSLYNKDDQLTLIAPPSPPTRLPGVDHPQSHCVSVLDLVDSARYVAQLVDASGEKNLAPFLARGNQSIRQLWLGWKAGSVTWRETGIGEIIRLDSSRDTALSVFGFAPGDSIFTSRGQCVVLGAYNYELWYEVVDAIHSHAGTKTASVASWSLSTCREMENAPEEYPTRRARWRDDDEDFKLPLSKQDHDDSSSIQLELEPNDELDRMLMSLVDALVLHRGLCSPQHLTCTDLSGALILHDVGDALRAVTTDSSVFQQDTLLSRLAFLFDLNQHAYRIARLLLSPTNPKPHLQHNISLPLPAADVSTTPRYVAIQNVLGFVRDRLFESQRERLVSEALRRTVTPTLCVTSTDSKVSELGITDEAEPKDMVRLKIRLCENVHKPFWRHNTGGSINKAEWAVPAPGDLRTSTLFVQVSNQLTGVEPKEWRRQLSSSTDTLPSTRTFLLELVEPPLLTTTETTSEVVVLADQTSQYLKFWDDLLTEIQSPGFPLFVPTTTATDTPMQLDVNSFLLLPEYAVSCGVSTEEALLWFLHVGQLLGMLWRARAIAPLQFVCLQFWRDLVDDERAHPGLDNRLSRARTTAIRTIRDGLCSVIPAECLQLSTPSSIRSRLSDTGHADFDVIQQHAVYDPESPIHAMFWDVVRRFSSYEHRALLWFLTGRSASAWLPSTLADDFADDAIEQWKRQIARSSTDASSTSNPLRVELADPLPAHSNPDACFPVIHVVDARHTRLHLPAYSSAIILRQKLTVAMSSLPMV